MSDLSETPFRIYAVNAETGEPECLVSADEFSVGEALLDCYAERIVRGIMYRPHDDQPGQWLINPFEASAGSGRLARATKDDREETA